MTTESFRKDVAKKLSDLQADPDEDAKIEFPKDLTSSDRKYIHKMAESFRLHTQSIGTGADRCIHIFKRPQRGEEDRRQGTHDSRAQNLQLSPAIRSLLENAAASTPPSDGVVALANIKPMSKMRTNVRRVVPLAAGDDIEAYWPDDDTWLPATLSEVYDDGTSYKIVWTSDGSESDVPADYVRRPPGSGGADLEGAVEMSAEVMEMELDKRRELEAYAKIGEKREELPAFKQRNEVIESVANSQVCLLVGETGCGKSTQVPQLILDSCPEAWILVMQPRKLAAVTLAERIAQERCQKVAQDVGYDAPFATKGTSCRLVFTTLGVFRRRLLRDTELKGITHVIFDEVHERDKLADFNMIFMRDLLERRPDLRLILMSATLQMETFERYFARATKIEIPGRVFPVSELYLDEVAATLYRQPVFRMHLGPGILCGGIEIAAGAEGPWNEKEWKTVVFRHTEPEDRDTLWGLRDRGLESQMMAPFNKGRLVDGLRKHDVLQQSSLAFDYPIIQALILHIDRMYKAAQKDVKKGEEQKPPGTILVFLPGWGDIDQLNKRLTQDLGSDRFLILPLHSQVSSWEQQQIFEPAPEGKRKIVLTTNIAEASITVEGTEFVIDSGRAKEVSYDPYLQVGTLTTSWISQASAKQRAGRAGRTQGGLCFHLMCRERFDKLDEFLPPELLRSPLEDSALTAKLMLLQMGSKEKVSSFLAKAPSPPEEVAIKNSLQLLVELGAFTANEDLTALGQHLTDSQLPPRLAKTVLWAILLGCLDDALCVVSAASGFTREPFRMHHLSKEDAQAKKRKLAEPYNSDHACLLKAVTGYTDSMDQRAFCDEWDLAAPIMRQIKDQQNRIFTELKENKSETFANRNRGNFQLVAAVLCAGIFPNVGRRRGNSDFLETQGGKVEARIHAASTYVPDKPEQWCFYQELTQVESTYRMKLVTPIDPVILLLLCGEGPITVEEDTGKGKGGKKGWGNANSSNVKVSLLDGWVCFRTDPATADQLQALRLGLQDVFQAFCQRPDQVPPPQSLSVLDQAASIFMGLGFAGGQAAVPSAGGLKRPYPGPAADARQVAPKVRATAMTGGGIRPPWQQAQYQGAPVARPPRWAGSVGQSKGAPGGKIGHWPKGGGKGKW